MRGLAFGHAFHACVASLIALMAASGVAAPVAYASTTVPLDTGVQLHSLSGLVPASQIRADLDLARAAGADVVRADVGWSSLYEQGPRTQGAWYRRQIDTFMHAAAVRGIKVIATAQTTPCWASSAPERLRLGCTGRWWTRGVDMYPPRDPSGYGAFVRWLTARYGAELAAVELWNEPDQDQHQYWITDHPAAAYAALVKAGYAGAKQGNPNVPVLVGAMAGADVAFLHQLYRLGIKGHYDGISLHPYCEPDAPNARPWPGEGSRFEFAAGLAAVRKAQLRAGDHAPLWITEFGWATGTGRAEVSAAKQAAFTAQAVHIAARMPYVRAAIVYALHDDGADAGNWMDNLGLLRPDGRPKPAFFALALAIGGPAQRARATAVFRGT